MVKSPVGTTVGRSGASGDSDDGGDGTFDPGDDTGGVVGDGVSLVRRAVRRPDGTVVVGRSVFTERH